MPKFQVEQYEIHVRTYDVVAASAAEAVAQVLRGDLELADGTADFVEIAEDSGLSLETYPDLAEALRQCGAIGQEEILPSIRDVTEID
ncbi:MAG: hypothetical protein SH850_25170 [Planctomycetaceae bacterium]|nr:hypothetical protein [Planctomycetaceae bacterium]